VRLSGRYLLQGVGDGPDGEVDALVLIDEVDHSEIVLPLDVARKLRVGLDYFLDTPGEVELINGAGEITRPAHVDSWLHR
jgi:hypothetical protein